MAQDDDDQPSGPPPAPGDRPWRHPSELGWEDRAPQVSPADESPASHETVAVAEPPEARSRPARPGFWMVLTVSALAGVVLASAAVMLVGELRESNADDAEADAVARLGADAVLERSGMTKGLSARAGGVAAHGVGIEGSDAAHGGVEVRAVVPDSPAARGALTTGDVVVAINGDAVMTLDQFAAVIETLEPGAVVQFEVMRGAERVALVVTLGPRSSGGDA